MTRTRRRGFVIAVLVLAAGLIAATSSSPAFGHVSVKPKEAARGSHVELRFRVPNERAVATVKVEIILPSDVRVDQLDAIATPGWSHSVERSRSTAQANSSSATESLDRVTWSGGRIEPDGAEEFVISLGPLPDTPDRVVFRALQTYESGEVVRWIDVPAGAEEVDHPAPVLALTGPPSVTTSSTGAGVTTMTSRSAVEPRDGNDPSDDPGTNWLAVAGLVAVVALASVAIASRRWRSPRTPE